MCNLQRTTYACSHQRKKPFFDQEANVQDEFETYFQRIRLINDILEKDRPECDWVQVSSERWDCTKLQAHHARLWNELLPQTLEHVGRMLVEASDELAAASTISIHHFLNAQLGRTIPSTIPTLLIPIDEDWRPADYDSQQILRSMSHCCYTCKSTTTLRTRVREHLQILDEFAVTACMDDVGWMLPRLSPAPSFPHMSTNVGADEDAARNTLVSLLGYRIVQPVRISGTEIRAYLVFLGLEMSRRWEEMEARAKNRRLGGEDYDVLDMAEEEERFAS